MEVQRMTMAGSATESKGFRRTLRRWKDRWRPASSASSKYSVLSPPSTRPPTNSSSTPPSQPLQTPPMPSPQPPASLAPTIETPLPTPIDPRNRSTSSSPSNTLKKLQPLTRRNTLSSELHQSARLDSQRDLPFTGVSAGFGTELPLNMVTTTIVAGGTQVKRKRQSKLRLSLSKRASEMPLGLSSPSTSSFFDRSSSRAAGRLEVVPDVAFPRYTAPITAPASVASATSATSATPATPATPTSAASATFAARAHNGSTVLQEEAENGDKDEFKDDK